jgi:hypothetical protein
MVYLRYLSLLALPGQKCTYWRYRAAARHAQQGADGARDEEAALAPLQVLSRALYCCLLLRLLRFTAVYCYLLLRWLYCCAGFSAGSLSHALLLFTAALLLLNWCSTAALLAEQREHEMNTLGGFAGCALWCQRLAVAAVASCCCSCCRMLARWCQLLRRRAALYI